MCIISVNGGSHNGRLTRTLLSKTINHEVVISNEDCVKRGQVRILLYTSITGNKVLEVVVVESGRLFELVCKRLRFRVRGKRQNISNVPLSTINP